MSPLKTCAKYVDALYLLAYLYFREARAAADAAMDAFIEALSHQAITEASPSQVWRSLSGYVRADSRRRARHGRSDEWLRWVDSSGLELEAVALAGSGWQASSVAVMLDMTTSEAHRLIRTGLTDLRTAPVSPSSGGTI